MTQSETQRMQCMEVWGGNQAVERCVETPGLKIWVYSRPFAQAVSGGDVYYVSSCASGRITRMLLADVSGHGEKVSHVATGLRDLMRRNVNYIRQTRFVRAMNRQFSEFAEHGGFATALVSTFFGPTKTLSLTNAGHPPPMILRRAEGAWSELQNGTNPSEPLADVPLGLFDEASYSQLETKLEPGDMLLSYSDAITESVNSEGQQLGQTGVVRLVNGLEADSANLIIPALLRRLTEQSARNLSQDDVTLLLCQATGGHPSLKNNLLAPFRLLGSVANHTHIG